MSDWVLESNQMGAESREIVANNTSIQNLNLVVNLLNVLNSRC